MSVTARPAKSRRVATPSNKVALRTRAAQCGATATDGLATVAGMAELWGLSRQYVYHILDGTYRPGASTSQRIARILDISVDRLLDMLEADS